MPSSLSHAMIAMTAVATIAPRTHLRSCLTVAVVCAVIPDVDAIGRMLPFDEGDIEALGGHRGFTHSLTFAGLAGLIVAAATLGKQTWDGIRVRLMLLILLATAAHGVLDAFTSIGATTAPVQFFSPFSSRGYTSPWQPIHGPFSELFLCLLPFGFMTYCVWRARRLPWPEWSPEHPTTIQDQGISFAATTDAATLRRRIYLLLLMLLALWAWRAETRIAPEQDDAMNVHADRDW